MKKTLVKDILTILCLIGLFCSVLYISNKFNEKMDAIIEECNNNQIADDAQWDDIGYLADTAESLSGLVAQEQVTIEELSKENAKLSLKIADLEKKVDELEK